MEFENVGSEQQSRRLTDAEAEKQSESITDDMKESLANPAIVKTCLGEVLYRAVLYPMMLEQSPDSEEDRLAHEGISKGLPETQSDLEMFLGLARGQSLRDVLKKDRGNYMQLYHHVRNTAFGLFDPDRKKYKSIRQQTNRDVKSGLISTEVAKSYLDPKSVVDGVNVEFYDDVSRSHPPGSREFLEKVRTEALKKAREIDRELRKAKK